MSQRQDVTKPCTGKRSRRRADQNTTGLEQTKSTDFNIRKVHWYRSELTLRQPADWLQTGKGVYQGCILSPCLFNLYAEYIMRNARLQEAEAGIKIAGRTIRCHHSYGRKWRTEEPLDESETGEWKNWLKLSSTFRKRRSWYRVPSLHGK